MPDKNVLLILNRAFVDEQFRRQLESDLGGTVSAMGIVLSDEAVAELMDALDEGGDFATGLDQRLSQSGISLNPAALLRQKSAGGKQAAESGLLRDFGGKNRTSQPKQRSIKHVETAQDTMVQPDEPLEADELDIEVEKD